MSATSEAARSDLYNGLSELLGSERADTLMSYLPKHDPDDVATRSDVEAIGSAVTGLRTELKDDIAGLRTESKDDIAGLRTELKGEIGELRTMVAAQGAALLSLQRTMIAGLTGIIAALAGIFIALL